MNEQAAQAKRDFSRIGFSLLAIGIITIVVQIPLALLWNYILADTALGDLEIMNWLLTFAPMYLIAVPLGIMLMTLVPAEKAPVRKLDIKGFLSMMCICMPIMYGGNIIGNLLSAVLSGGTAENALLDYIMGNPLYSFLFAVVLAPVIEEYVFRKQIIDRLGKYGEKAAILFSALTFGLFHMNLFQFFYAFGLGLIFAYVYCRTRALRYSIIMHMAINFLGSVIAPLLLSALDMELIAQMEAGTADLAQITQLLPALGAFGLYSMFLLLSVVSGVVILIKRWGTQQFVPASRELPAKVAGKAACLNVGVILFAVFCLAMMVFSLF